MENARQVLAHSIFNIVSDEMSLARGGPITVHDHVKIDEVAEANL